MFTDEFLRTVLQKAQESGSTSTLTERAAQLLRKEASKQVISPSDISVQDLLHAVLDYAPCDAGKRFVACAIICAAEGLGTHIERSDETCGERLALLARDWLKFVLWPGMFGSLL